MIRYRENAKYTLEDNYSRTIEIYPDQDIATEFIGLSAKGEFFIKKGYGWNGANVALDKNMIQGSLVHDALYELIERDLLPSCWRKAADELLVEICRERGMGWFRAKYVFAAVRMAGWVYT